MTKASSKWIMPDTEAAAHPEKYRAMDDALSCHT